MKKQIGLVLAGGGAKGAFEIGAYKALEEVGLAKNIIAISGTSVGALNAVLIAQGDIKTAEKVWKSIDKDFITVKEVKDIFLFENDKVDIEKVIEKRINIYSTGKIIESGEKFHAVIQNILNNGVLSRESLVRIIDENLDYKKIMKYSGKLYSTATNVAKGKAEHFDLKKARDFEQLKSMVLASAALPLLYEKEMIDGNAYWDGGLKMNTPVQPLKKAGIKDIIVVHCSEGRKVKKKDREDINILLEITPRGKMGNLLTGTIDFGNEKIVRNLELGYKNAIIQLWENKERLVINSKVVEKVLQTLQANELQKELSKKQTERAKEIEMYGKTSVVLEKYLASTPNKKKKIMAVLRGIVPVVLLLPRMLHSAGMGTAEKGTAGISLTKLGMILGGVQEAKILLELYRKLGNEGFELLTNYEMVNRGDKKVLVRK